MTDHERQMIAAYLPTPRDPDLKEFEYYVMDNFEHIQRVYICDINPGKECTVYGVRYSSTGYKFRGGIGGGYGTTYMSELYDNKPDCRKQTHMCYNNWEYLRRLQEVEHEEC